VDTDLSGRTAIVGLFAAGEVACTRVHGANRLASNSLLEGLVFGARAAATMVDAPGVPAMLPPARVVDWQDEATREPAVERVDASAVPALMWHAAGLVRHAEGLATLVATLGPLAASLERLANHPDAEADAWREANIARVAWLIARAAARRTESRGGHRRADFPERDDVNWKVHVADRKTQ
jgi:L-aspartate oxidase